MFFLSQIRDSYDHLIIILNAFVSPVVYGLDSFFNMRKLVF